MKKTIAQLYKEAVLKEAVQQKEMLRKYIKSKIGDNYNFAKIGGKYRFSSDGKFNIYIDNNGWIDITDKDGKEKSVGIGSATKLPKMAIKELDKVLK